MACEVFGLCSMTCLVCVMRRTRAPHVLARFAHCGCFAAPAATSLLQSISRNMIVFVVCGLTLVHERWFPSTFLLKTKNTQAQVRSCAATCLHIFHTREARVSTGSTCQLLRTYYALLRFASRLLFKLHVIYIYKYIYDTCAQILN